MQNLRFSEIKTVMHSLLLSSDFDSFLLREAQITTFSTFQIDGRFHGEWLNSDETDRDEPLPDYASWSMVRPFCYSLIRGKRTPLSFRFVFALAPYNVQKLLSQTGIDLSPSDIHGLYLNLHYDGKCLNAVTGTSLSVFTLDKSLDHAWDELVEKFFLKKGLFFEK